MRIGEQMLTDVAAFSEAGGGLRLRGYQRRVAKAVIHSIFRGRGNTLVVVFPRQSGKNELQAQIEAYLLWLLSYRGAEIVKVCPTWRPQAQNAMQRLERVLRANFLTRGAWRKEHGYIYRIGQARITFLSGAPEASIVGATASTLLSVDEAQDVRPDKYDKDIAPMAAAGDATRVLWGTAWTADTLLARELRAAQAAQRAGGSDGSDGVDGPRAFVLQADAVAAEVPAYGRFVAGQVARLGRAHPLVKTQFYSEELDGESGMFPPERAARMWAPDGGAAGDAGGSVNVDGVYALLIDVAGEDAAVRTAVEGGVAELSHPGRDATALTVVQVDSAGAGQEGAPRGPVYRPVLRRQWLGVGQAVLFDEILAEARRWAARWVVVDATGVGAGLAAFLERALPGRVRPFTFSLASKSRLGWDFLAVVDGGRWREPPALAGDPLTEAFRRQLAFCRCELLPGPNRLLRWGVPDGTRDLASGALVRDDLLISAALCAVLDREAWSASSPGPLRVVPRGDPLDEMVGF